MDTNNKKHYEHLLKKSKVLTKKDILSIPELKENPISTILIKKYTNGDAFEGEKLIKDLLDFNLVTKADQKYKFIFGIYDLDCDGYISSLDLFDILKVLNKGVLVDWKLQNIVDKTFAEIGKYRSKLNYEQFKYIIDKRLLENQSMF